MRRRKRLGLIPVILMVIGAAALFVLAARYLAVPFLVWAGGFVG